MVGLASSGYGMHALEKEASVGTALIAPRRAQWQNSTSPSALKRHVDSDKTGTRYGTVVKLSHCLPWRVSTTDLNQRKAYFGGSARITIYVPRLG